MEARSTKPIQTTAQLGKIISDAQPIKDHNKHPATRAFQAIRLYINGELTEVEQGLTAIIVLILVVGWL